MQLENSMLMYGIYNAETLEKLITTVHNIHNTTSSHERLCGTTKITNNQISICALLRSTPLFINSLLYLRTIQDKYVTPYMELITQLQIYASAIKILAKGYLSNTLVTT